MNHFHLSIKFNMGEVLYSLIIAVVVGLLYFTSVDGHVLRCKYFFTFVFFLICTQKANNVIYNELFSDDQVLKRVAIAHVYQHMYCEIIFYSWESMVVASQNFLGLSAFSHQRLCYTKLIIKNRLHLCQRRNKYSF